ncbi:hypothetical protein [Sphaerisporangium perillae]|uniref:hypothetical protein n=1 Tax=Sphaerisporangium perillae TaxID=2935860 RepID=UPI002010A9AD|nr:hypothetical protein [Sphaerisporangium perillae]
MFAAVALLVVMILTVAMFELTVNNRHAKPVISEPDACPEETAQGAPEAPKA